jgi:hypothetical protein
MTLLTKVRHTLVPAKLLPPLGEVLQVRGARPLKGNITAWRRIFLPLQRLKILAPATQAPVQNKLGGRNLWFRLSLKKPAN